MTEKRIDEIYDRYLLDILKRLDAAENTGHIGTVANVAHDITHELIKEIIKLERELENKEM